MLTYSQTRVFSFARGKNWDTIIVTPASESVVVLQQMVQDIQQMMEVVISDFFAGNSGDAVVRAALAGVLSRFLSSPLMAQYQALAPDFFQWLEVSPPTTA